MNEAIIFGQVVKERRNVLGLTQTELARRVGCAAITIRKIEADALRPSVQMAELIALALNIPEEEQLAFVRLARSERAPSPIPTPSPLPGEIGLADLSGRANSVWVKPSTFRRSFTTWPKMIASFIRILISSDR